MLVRLVVENFLSIAEQRTFDMLPNDKLGKLRHHVQDAGGVDLLKLGVLYGANAAGKSTVFKAMATLKALVSGQESWVMYAHTRHRFNEDNGEPITLGVEFLVGERAFLYAVQLREGIVAAEELYRSGLGGKDELIFRRTSGNGKNQLELPALDGLGQPTSEVKQFIEKNTIHANQAVLASLAAFEGPQYKNIKIAFTWFTNTLQLISPSQYAIGLAQRIDQDPDFGKFVKETLKSSHLGISDVVIEKLTLNEFFGRDDANKASEIRAKFEANPDGILPAYTSSGQEVSIVMENDKPVVKMLVIRKGDRSNVKDFSSVEESDGTQRLLDFLPAFYIVARSPTVFFIDEIERSLHPLLIHKLLEKFSLDEHTRGQLIMTTHESNLLDQDILRRDEIWFVEKDMFGATDLYSLNKFREHNTIDIRKGYLNGRYGGIPFLGKLDTLNWHEHDTV
ncbi:AAA family ATPase [Neolewinella antarctica]|uniref:ATPase AAA-type core domain-containing protein n=1 Tax=Neolewinella antarctica TaxID=442734 RepID=A0ABX0XF35_9BACT|nr:ATP-binding protein [Neolewinella antarctica]NJC27856.1 hypothetical protein [Neolewinella antarctica]